MFCLYGLNTSFSINHCSESKDTTIDDSGDKNNEKIVKINKI